MAVHELNARRETLHGAFSPDLPPVLTVDAGDTVHLSTIDVAWGLEPPTDAVTPRRKIEPRDPVRDDGPAMTGPIAVRNCPPGSVLAIRIEEIVPAKIGFTWVAGSEWPDPSLNEFLGLADEPMSLALWRIDQEGRTATSDRGHRVPLRPFPGTIGIAQAMWDWQSGWHPRRTGGNMDCRELVEGATLYLPVEVDGALLSAGDGHAAQGDGEICGTAIECAFERISLHIDVRAHDDLPIDGPVIRVADSWVTLAFDRDLRQAARRAVKAMIELLMVLRGVSRADAAVWVSVQGDVRITQMVNGVVGAHVVMVDAG